MNKNLILNILTLLILITGIICIIISIFKPKLLIKVISNKKDYVIKDEEGFIKYIQKLYIALGGICCIISILSLLNIIGNTFFSLSLSWIAVAIGTLHSRSLNKFTIK